MWSRRTGRRPRSRIAIAIAVLLCAGCGSSPHAARPGTLSARRRAPVERDTGPSCAELLPTEGPRLCALVHLDDEAGEMEVRLRLEPGALPESRREVALRFRQTVFGPRYAQDFVEVLDREGWPESLGRVTEPVELSYRVRLDFFERGEPREGRSGPSWRRPGGWHLTGATFLPDVWVDGERAEVPATLMIDVGRRPLYTSAGSEQRIFDARSLLRLADEAYEVGPLVTARREVGSTTLWVGSSDEEGEAYVEALADALARAFGLLDARLGPPSTDSVLFAHHVFAHEEEWGERLGTSLVLVTPDATVRDPIYGLAKASIHELGHLWIPGSHVIDEQWLEEGVNDYLAVEVMAALTEQPTASTARVVLRSWSRFVRGAAERTLREPNPDDPRWAVDAGLVAGFCLDAHLRESGSSLPVVLRHTLAREEARVGTEALLEDLAAVSASSASYLEAMLITQGAFAIDECLERRGLHVREVRYQGLGDDTIATDILGLASLRPFTRAQAFEAGEVADGSPLEEGDIVTRVADHPVAELADVAWALRDTAEGDRVEIVLRRRGAPLTVDRALPALDDDARSERTYLELVPFDAEP